MTAYFLLIELLFFIFTGYILFRKKELAVIYLPVLIFSRNIFIPSTRALIWYLILAVIMGYVIYKNKGFSRHNPYAILLVLYFTILLFLSTDPGGVRAHYIHSVVFLLSIPVIHNLYKIYDRSFIEDELYKMFVIILVLFISNTVIATLTGYTSGRGMYGLSGITYGNLFATDFNIVPIAIFFILYKLSCRYSVINMLIALISFAFIVLSMRRSVMVVAIAAAGLFMLMLLIQKNKSNALITIYATSMVVVMIFLYTNFFDTFLERYEHRGLQDREFVSLDEGRFVEYRLVYTDMFVHKRYSAVIGYELFNSSGNYGNQLFGSRSLHSDITVLIHASGLVGLLVYLLMIIRTFYISYKSSWSSYDKLILMFCATVFIVFTITGRFTSAHHMISLVLIVLLPISNKDDE